MGRILITGGTGFIGSAIAREVQSRGHEVLVTGRPHGGPCPWPCLSPDFHDLDWPRLSPIDAVVHQAAVTDTMHPAAADFYFVNVHYARALFLEAARFGCRRFVYASSCAVYGRRECREDGACEPLNAYGHSKKMFDDWCQGWDHQSVGLRYSNVYGPGETHKGRSASMILQIADQIKSGRRPVLFRWGQQERDFVHVDDVVAANLLALSHAGGGIFNVGSGRPTSFNRVVAVINSALGTDVEPQYVDNPMPSRYQDRTCCDLTKSNQTLGYSPRYDADMGIRRYVSPGAGGP